MNTPESSDFELSAFEKQLKSLAPRESTVHRDDLLFRAGYEAALAAVSRGEVKVNEVSSRIQKQTANEEDLVAVEPRKFQLDPWIQWVAIATLILVALTCGVLGMKVGERRTIVRYESAKNNLKQLSGPIVAYPPSNSNRAGQLEPLPPVDESEDSSKESFASSNEPNYIELRDQVLRFGVDAMPENYSFAAPMKSSKERKPITPLSYGAVMELSAERY